MCSVLCCPDSHLAALYIQTKLRSVQHSSHYWASAALLNKGWDKQPICSFRQSDTVPTGTTGVLFQQFGEPNPIGFGVHAPGQELWQCYHMSPTEGESCFVINWSLVWIGTGSEMNNALHYCVLKTDILLPTVFSMDVFFILFEFWISDDCFCSPLQNNEFLQEKLLQRAPTITERSKKVRERRGNLPRML